MGVGEPPDARRPSWHSHSFYDATDRPTATLLAQQPIEVFVEEGATTGRTKRVPYKIPKLAAIKRNSKISGLKAISTFSGCGGSSLGLNWAGIDVMWASEFVEAARDVYRANNPSTIVDDRDIREVKPEDILDAIQLDVGELDIFEGSPPCASFSTAGKRHQHWGEVKAYSDTEQRTDDLFWEFLRLVDGTRPKVFVAENVAGLAKGKARGFLKQIVQDATKLGYRVQVWDLDAQYLGVPQRRRRLIFVGVRDDLNPEHDPSPPAPIEQRVFVGDALPWLLDPTGKIPTVASDQPGLERPELFDNFLLGPRRVSLLEIRRLGGFPDDFKLPAQSYAQGHERIGRSVVPPMYLHVGERLVKTLRRTQ